MMWHGKQVQRIAFTVEVDGAPRVAEFLTDAKLLDLLADQGSLGELLRDLVEGCPPRRPPCNSS